jgi:hypothetical protein
MNDTCRLRSTSGESPSPCDGGACVFWRALHHVGAETADGCAIQHFELLGDHELTAWLLSVKERIERGPLGYLASPAEDACGS